MLEQSAAVFVLHTIAIQNIQSNDAHLVRVCDGGVIENRDHFFNEGARARALRRLARRCILLDHGLSRKLAALKLVHAQLCKCQMHRQLLFRLLHVGESRKHIPHAAD